MAKITYKDLYSQVVEEIRKENKFLTFDQFNNQLRRSGVAPLAFGGGGSLPDISAGQIIAAVQDLLEEAIPPVILSGLEVTATTSPSDYVNISSGTGSVGGKIYTLASDTVLRIPFDLITDVYYINLYLDRLMVETTTSTEKLTLAKINVPNPGTTSKIYDNVDDANIQNGDAYIQNYKEFKLYGINDKFEEDTKELIKSNLGDILAETIVGNLTLSENLKITNTTGTLELDSRQVLIKDSDGNVSAKFNKNGTFYYNTSGQEVAKFSVGGAKVGNINVTPTTIQSENFVSGNLGAGFQIKDDGDAEFNNIRARGKLTSSVFEKDTVSVIGGNLLVMDGDVLSANMSADDSSNLKISGDTSFSVGDVLRIKDGTDDEWLTVTADNGGGSYSVTRDQNSQYSANSNPAWQKGTSVVNYGQSGEGGIFMTSSESNAPYISILTHSGSPWSDSVTHSRFGQLNGFLDYSSSAFGIAIGTTDSYMSYDPTQGLRIKGSVTITGGDVPPKTYYQADEPPTSGQETPLEGDYWVDTDASNALYTFQGTYGESAAGWSLIGGSSSITTFYQGESGDGIPTSTAVGDLWYDTQNDKLYRADIVGADQITAGEWELTIAAGTDDDGNLTTSVLPTTNIGIPASSGLYLGADYMGYFDSTLAATSGETGWKSYIDCTGNFYFCGDGSNYISWDGINLDVRGQLNADDIVAGSIVGREICTASSGSRIEFNTTCFSAYDDSSAPGNEVFKIAMDGIEAGDVFIGDQDTGNYMKWCNADSAFNFFHRSNPASSEAICCVRICDGNIYANDICLVDPNDSSVYSYLSGGHWYFQDNRGIQTPYVKRLQSGTACTGDTIDLQGWSQSPTVIIGIKDLDAYSQTYSGQDQRWCVYHDNVAYYENSALDYGYTFDVHARLQLSANTEDECIHSAAFGACVTTSANTCSTLVKIQANYWTHPAAPSNWCYGCMCFTVCYRCSGCVTWQGSCLYYYEQPHANTTEIQTTYTCSYTLNLPSTETWEIMAEQTGRTWHDSTIAFGSTVNCCCCRAIGANTVSTTTDCCVAFPNFCINQTDTSTAALTLAGTNPSNIYYTCVHYVWASHTGNLCAETCKNGSGNYSYGRAYGYYCSPELGEIVRCCTGISCASGGTGFCTGTPQGASWNISGNTVESNVNVSSFCIRSRYCYDVYAGTGSGWARSIGCSYVCGCTGSYLIQCYQVTTGSAGSNEFCCLHSLTNTLGTQTIIDPTGCVNWMAVSYT